MEDKLLLRLDKLNKKRLSLIEKIQFEVEDLESIHSILMLKNFVDQYLDIQQECNIYIDLISETNK